MGYAATLEAISYTMTVEARERRFVADNTEALIKSLQNLLRLPG